MGSVSFKARRWQLLKDMVTTWKHSTEAFVVRGDSFAIWSVEVIVLISLFRLLIVFLRFAA